MKKCAAEKKKKKHAQRELPTKKKKCQDEHNRSSPTQFHGVLQLIASFLVIANRAAALCRRRCRRASATRT